MSNEPKDIGQELSDKIDGMFRAETMANELEFINTLTEEIKTENPRIPEPVFTEIFWPYFNGTMASAEDREKVLFHWLGLAGSGSAEVDVVDKEGKVLFTVPPMIDTSGLVIIEKGRHSSMAAIYSEAMDQARLHSELAKRHLKDGLVPKLSEKIQQGSASWNSVLQYYGVVPENQAVTPASSASSFDEGDLQFEE